MKPETFEGEIRVASRIVDYLSSGLYNSPAACLKELVNNSYDADATVVEVLVKPDADRIVITDNGVGISRQEFQDHFDRISESHKRDSGDTTPSGRPKVGKIGIGFIAANELCDVMEIISTKSGSEEMLIVDVNFREMRLDREVRDRARDNDEYAKGDYTGRVEEAPKADHYTYVILKQVRDQARIIFLGATFDEEGSHSVDDRQFGRLSAYGKDPESVRDEVVERARDWDDLDAYTQTMLRVGLNVPVQYLPDWHSRVAKSDLSKFSREVEKLDFKVLYDGSDLRKPVLLPVSDAGFAYKAFSIEGNEVSAKGYFYAHVGVLRPEWLNGVMIRIRNAAVGDYDDGFLGFPHSEGTLFQRWITAEVWADDRLEDALNIDRRTLRITHPSYVELQSSFHDELSSFLVQVRRELYSDRSAERRRSMAIEEVGRLRDVIENSTAQPSLETKKAVRKKQRSVPEATKKELGAVLRSFSVSEVYSTALEVAEQTLSKSQYEKFANALAKRLLG